MGNVQESDLLSKFQGVLTSDEAIVEQRMKHFEGKGDQIVCTNYRGITLLQSPRKHLYQDSGFHPRYGAVYQIFMRGHGRMSIQATSDLGIWRRFVCLYT